MNMSTRDRRALAALGVALVLGLVYRFWPADSTPAVVAPAAGNLALTEKRLAKLRESAATVPAKEKILEQLTGDLAVGKRPHCRRHNRASAGSDDSNNPQVG